MKPIDPALGENADPIGALMRAWFPSDTHPYRVLERRIDALTGPEKAVLEIGCGRTAPVLTGMKGRARSLAGIDLVDFTVDDPDIRLFRNDAADMRDIADASVDLAFSRSVMEHVPDVAGCYREIHRVLRPGGRYVFLTPNFWDYASLISYAIPNRFHQSIVNATEGRDEDDTFPTFYRSNTRGAIARLAAAHGLAVDRFEHLGQYPCYLVFNRTLFVLGSKYEKFLERHRRLHWLRGWILAELKKP